MQFLKDMIFCIQVMFFEKYFWTISKTSKSEDLENVFQSLHWSWLKVAFFRKWDSFFQIPKNYSELEIWISCLLIWVGISNFKLRIVFWSNFLGDWEIWKTNLTFWKKAPLPSIISCNCFTVNFFCNAKNVNIHGIMKNKKK
jgi:hypothetical protein